MAGFIDSLEARKREQTMLTCDQMIEYARMHAQMQNAKHAELTQDLWTV